MDVVSLPLLAQMVGEPYTTADRRVKAWGLEPSIRVASGRGVERLFSRADALAFLVAWLLQTRGIQLAMIQKAILVCRRSDLGAQVEAGDRYLVANNRGLFLLSQKDALLNPGEEPAAAVVIDLKRLAEQLDAKLREIAAQLRGAARPKRRAKASS
jgi:hypothetical protein